MRDWQPIMVLVSKYLFQAPAHIYVSNNYSDNNYVSNTILGLRYAIVNETVWPESKIDNLYLCNSEHKTKSWEPRRGI